MNSIAIQTDTAYYNSSNKQNMTVAFSYMPCLEATARVSNSHRLLTLEQ